MGRLRAAAILAALTASCGGTPTAPDPVVPPPPVVVNTPPVIGKFTVQGNRSKEPASFADLLESVPVSVAVTDAESPIAELTFNWSATTGTFTGTGPQVTWKAPGSAVTPVDVTLSLEVVETYKSAGKIETNRVTGSTTLSLHDSTNEVGTMAWKFLLDFSDSNKPVAEVMQNFEPTCYGTAEETVQVALNRQNFQIKSYTVGLPTTTVNFGGICPLGAKPGDACSRILAGWTSLALQDAYDSAGNFVAKKGQTVTAGPSIDQIAGMYYPAQKRWRLCDSSYDPSGAQTFTGGVRRFFGGGLVP